MIREYKDRRIKRTIGRIRDAFRELVLENDYDSLNVSMLCEKAHIGRKTFYVYYPALDAIFEEELERITVKFLERIKGLRPPEDFADITREFYHFQAQRRLYGREHTVFFREGQGRFRSHLHRGHGQ